MPVNKLAEVYKEDGTLYKKYNSMSEAAKDLNVTLVNLSRQVIEKGEIVVDGILYRVTTSGVPPLPRKQRPVVYDAKATLQPGETEDECRRRLGLNPYGEWRNDEWMNAMFDRVHKELYPDGYDEHAAWLAMKGKDRREAGKTKLRDPDSNLPGYDSGENSYNIDPEFLDYIK